MTANQSSKRYCTSTFPCSSDICYRPSIFLAFFLSLPCAFSLSLELFPHHFSVSRYCKLSVLAQNLMHTYVYHHDLLWLLCDSQSMSGGCTKVMFWSSPYACHSETASCTHAAGDKFFDFTPLQANPGEKAWKTQHG